MYVDLGMTDTDEPDKSNATCMRSLQSPPGQSAVVLLKKCAAVGR